MQHPHLPLSVRLKAVRKLLARTAPYLLVANKPEGMIRSRGENYVIEPVRQLIEAERGGIEGLARSLSVFENEAKADLSSLWNNAYFSSGDALAAYGLVRQIKPRQIIEIGSGNSTHIMRRAALAEKIEVEIACIDPAPRREIDTVASTVIRKSVLETDAGQFDRLDAGDILFIDGSHYAFNGTDVPFLMLEVLPRLKSGVVVHVHDIALPFEYSQEFTRRNYNEQYVLGALLLGGGWKILFPVAWLHSTGQWPDGGSFWFVRR
ncbi:MAG: class I SAM-dependent methyltransferase [Magnetospirillum sp.]|nr:class I SAM-dependent methyltransferase [Magnetospirillum sp.]